MAYEQPQNIRVFVSSTFLDLFDEREYLIKRVFPELRHICRERGLLFTEIDLRWGLTYEDSSFGRVISTCLQEIDRCRPFFIGILGDRYGWIPEFQDIHKNAYLMEEHRWLEEAVLEGSSLVEMEFNYAVLNSLQPMPGASFYVLEREETESKILTPQDELGAHKLESLRQRIFDCKRPVRTFSTPQELGNLVRDDLLRAIEVLHPQKNERLPLGRERRSQEAFSISRRQAYVARQETLARLSDHALSDAQPLVVYAASGLGKSALLAYWSRFFAQRHPEMTVVSHFIGSVSSDAGHEGLLRRILMEIKDFLGATEEIPNSVEEMESALTNWISRVPEKRLVFVIDALNQLEPGASGLEWLPEHLPSNVRFIFSTIPGKTLNALRTRGWLEYELLPLQLSDREAIITRFLSEFHKSLSLAECKAVAANPKSENPLFLRTLLEELRLFGTFERLDEQIQHYLASDDIGDLFQRVLERIENDFGSTLIQSVMSYVWASRNGLTEGDFLALTKLHRSEASQLLISLEYHLVQRQGYIRFFHDYLRQAVERKYLADESSRKAAHAILAEFYLAEPTSERRAEELPWQFIEAERWDDLHAWLTDIPEFMRYVDENSQWKYIGYWIKLEGKFEIVSSYRNDVAHWREHPQPQIEVARVLDRVGRFLLACGEYKGAEEFLSEALEIIRSERGPDHPETAIALNALGILFQTVGEYKKAEPRLEHALAILESTPEQHPVELARALNSFATLLYYLGKFEPAAKLFERALKLNEEFLGLNHQQTIESMTNLAVMHYSMQNLDEAERIFMLTLQRTKTALGEDTKKYADLLANLGAIERRRHNHKKAEQLYQTALQIYERFLGPNHPDTATMLQSLAVVLKLSGNLESAERLYRRSLSIFRKTSSSMSPNLVPILNNLAGLLIEQGVFDEGEQLLHELIKISQKHMDSQYTTAVAAQLKLALLLERKGLYVESQRLYELNLSKLSAPAFSWVDIEIYHEQYIGLLEKMGLVRELARATNELLLIKK